MRPPRSLGSRTQLWYSTVGQAKDHELPNALATGHRQGPFVLHVVLTCEHSLADIGCKHRESDGDLIFNMFMGHGRFARPLLRKVKRPSTPQLSAVRLASYSTAIPSRPLSGSSKKKYAVLLASGAAGSALVSLASTRESYGDFPEDPRDVEALSTVPLGKLLSGWM